MVDPSLRYAGQPAQPTYKIVLENDRVRVRDVTFPAGVLETPMHTHEYRTWE